MVPVFIIVKRSIFNPPPPPLVSSLPISPSFPLFLPWRCLLLSFTLLSVQTKGHALAHYHEAVAIDPAFADAYSNMGNAYKDMGRLPDAIKCYRCKPAKAGEGGGRRGVGMGLLILRVQMK